MPRFAANLTMMYQDLGFLDRFAAAAGDGFTLIEYLLDLYWYVVFAAVIVSWLLAFNVINQHNNIVRTILRVLMTLTEPVFRQIRRVIPPIGGLDFSPLVVLVAIWWLRASVIPWVALRLHLYS